MTEEKKWLPTEKDIEDYKLLKDMLRSQKNEFNLLSKKKADGELNHMKIRMVNRALEPLKELFKNEESYKFLDTLNEDDIPTNSDIVLIISQYKTAINEFENSYHHGRDWHTEEYLKEQKELEEDYYDEDE